MWGIIILKLISVLLRGYNCYPNKAMKKNRRVGPRYDIDWWFISTTQIKKLAIGLFFLVIGFGAYFGIRIYLDHRAEAARLAAGDQGASSSQPEKSGYFLEMEGDVKVKRNGAYEWIGADKRMNLNAGDLVKTGSSSSARILLFDGTEITIKSESLTMIQSSVEDPKSKVRNVAVRVASGAIDMSTAKKNRPESSTQIQSPTSTAQLGEMTQAGLSVDPDGQKTSIQIYRGEGEITSGGSRLRLTSLEGVTVAKEGDINPRYRILSPPDLIDPPNLKQFAFVDLSKELIYMSWRQVSGARAFRLMVSTTALFSSPLVDFRVAGKEQSVRVAGLIEGTYFWRVVAIDQNGTEGRPSAARRFRIITQDKRLQKYDVTPPTLTIEEPRMSGNIALVRGKTEPGAMLTVDGEQVDVETDGSFFHPVILRQSGKSDLEFVAQDASGNETRKTKAVYAEFY